MSKDHYLPFFVGDFMASTATWTGPERGLYIQLLAFQWASGPLPCDLDRLARAVNYDAGEFKQLWPIMAAKFKNGDGRLTNTRLEAIRDKNTQLHEAREQKARHAAESRWEGKRNAQALLEASTEYAQSMPSDPIRSNPKGITKGLTTSVRPSLSGTLKGLAKAKRMPT